MSATQPVFRIPVILVSYSDEPLTYGSADFDLALFDTTHATATGSLYDYYRWASGNRLSVLGRVVATVHLPHDKLYYGYNSFGLSRTATPHNAAGLVLDALVACSSQVQWSDFDLDRDGFVDMLWVVHAGLPGEASPRPFQQRHLVHHLAARRLLDRHQRLRDRPSSCRARPPSTSASTASPPCRNSPTSPPGSARRSASSATSSAMPWACPDLYDTRDAGAPTRAPATGR